MYDLILKGGQIVTHESTYLGDILVKNGVIAAITNPDNGSYSAARIINVSGKYIFPGIIDPHCHLHFGGGGDVHDFYDASIMAAFGGVTTFIDFSNGKRGQSVFSALKSRKDEISESVIDYAIHAEIMEASRETIAEIKDIVDFGCPSIKMYTTYEHLHIQDEDIIAVMEEAGKWGALPIFHAESDIIAKRINKLHTEQGKLDYKYFPESKPNICEEEAINRVIAYAKFTSCPLHIFHLTTEEGLKIIAQAQATGVDITTETCPHYLLFNKEKLQNDDGYLYIMSPPLREKRDVEAMWQGISDGTINHIGSDNCTFSKEYKLAKLNRDKSGRPVPDYTKVPNGVTGMEERIHVLMAEGVEKGRISLNKLCEITSYSPAKIYGMLPKKGIIQPGSDADFMIYDPNREGTVTPKTMHHKIDYNIYNGLKVKGWPVMTISRGEVIVEDEEFKGKKGRGQFVVRVPKKSL